MQREGEVPNRGTHSKGDCSGRCGRLIGSLHNRTEPQQSEARKEKEGLSLRTFGMNTMGDVKGMVRTKRLYGSLRFSRRGGSNQEELCETTKYNKGAREV